MANTTLKYYARADKLGYPIPSTMMGYKIKPKENNLVELPPTLIIPEGHIVVKHPGKLRYFYRVTQQGDIIPNSLFITLDKPKSRDVVEWVKTKEDPEA